MATIPCDQETSSSEEQARLTLRLIRPPPQIQAPVTLTNPGVSQLCIRDDSRIVSAASWDGSVRVFGWKTLKPLAVLRYHRDQVQCVTFSDHPQPSRRLMAAGSRDQLISLWSIYSESRVGVQTETDTPAP